jgi:hypothetical protein
VILEIVAAKNSKTEICKGKCPNMQEVLKNEKNPTSNKLIVWKSMYVLLGANS